ncbi:MAG: hypothetical protein IPK50_00860 [Fibrobacterota bacterium]|nr:MAG: hypothetical protein IPK50_00860 [Fibrobacterota bacterium]
MDGYATAIVSAKYGNHLLREQANEKNPVGLAILGGRMKKKITLLVGLLAVAGFCGKRILILGDSITQGSSNPVERPWRDWILQIANAAGKPYTPVGLASWQVYDYNTKSLVVNYLGVGVCSADPYPMTSSVAKSTFPGPHGAQCGIATDGLLSWFKTKKPNLVNAGGADVVVIASGTNDLGNLNEAQKQRSATETLAQMELLVKEVKNTLPNAKIYVTTLLPVDEAKIKIINPQWITYQPKIDEYNAKLFGWSEGMRKSGIPVEVIDWTRAVTVADLHDGLHPHSAGSEKLAKFAFARMELVPQIAATVVGSDD